MDVVGSVAVAVAVVAVVVVDEFVEFVSGGSCASVKDSCDSFLSWVIEGI